MAAVIWRTFASGRLSGWSGGSICYPAPEVQDGSYVALSPTGPLPGGVSPPAWMLELIARLDARLPRPEVLRGCLDDDSLTLPDSPAAFRIPGNPSAPDAGACLAAARVILACREDLLPPVFTSAADAAGLVERASWNALMIGGEQAFLTAAAIISDPGMFAAAAEAPDIDRIQTED